eukprot:m.169282 g.169282  ORF g.169282 m.169282 type:complete len:113 (-) comp17802_c1_seq3:2391-2729(-)
MTEGDRPPKLSHSLDDERRRCPRRPWPAVRVGIGTAAVWACGLGDDDLLASPPTSLAALLAAPNMDTVLELGLDVVTVTITDLPSLPPGSSMVTDPPPALSFVGAMGYRASK